MNTKKWLIIVLLIIIFVVGVYLVFTSGYFEVDPFTLVTFIMVLGLIIYLYIQAQRRKNE